jgi:HD-GYP domain-containing protein (c-di-GMP phosphodiesterase class II)
MSTRHGHDAGDDERALTAAGGPLLLRVTALLRTARTYDVSNQAFQRQLAEFMALLRTVLADEDEVALVVVADYLYLNGVRIKATAQLLGPYHALMSEFERRRVGGLRFLDGVSEAEVERFFQVFLAADDPTLAERLPELVAEAAVTHIIVVEAHGLDAEDLARGLDEAPRTPQERRGRAKRVFWRAVAGAKRIVLRARQTGRPDLRHAKRLVQPIVDNLMQQDHSIVGLTALKDHDEYTYAHCVNVSILSIGMGQSLGLPRQALADLGVAGLLHDLGKMSIDGEVLRKPGALTAEEWQAMRRHPIEGAKMIARLPGLSGVMVDAMRACLEHHMNYNRTGYPDIAADWGQATMSRIVAMADCFDAITAHRAYHKRARTPFEALQLLLGPNRTNFDPAVLWSLVRTVGLYPAGTVMQTASGHVLLAVTPDPRDPARPNARVLVRPDGTQPEDETAEEWSPIPEHESVVRVLLPEETAIDAQQKLAA